VLKEYESRIQAQQDILQIAQREEKRLSSWCRAMRRRKRTSIMRSTG
jgi:hypothetical protein